MDKIKYIKYKEKYLQLKKSLNTLNNADNADNNIDMVGGFPFGSESKSQFFIKGSTGTLYTMAVVTGNTLARFNERRVRLGLSSKTDLHLTLLTIHFNLVSQKYKDLIYPKLKSEFNNRIRTLYDQYIKNFDLWSQKKDSSGNTIGGKWDIFKNKFVRVYDCNEETLSNYQNFLNRVISLMEGYIGERLNYEDRVIIYGTGTDTNRVNYRYYFTSDPNGLKQYLFALNIDHAIADWKPHITLLEFNELSSSTIDFYRIFYNTSFINGKPKENCVNLEYIESLFKEWSWATCAPISSLKFSRDIKRIYISSKQIKQIEQKDSNGATKYKYEKHDVYINL